MQSDSLFVPATRLVYFRSTQFGVDAWDAVGHSAQYQGRFHRKGDPLPLYASDSEFATLRELELHTDSALEPRREILRRITAIAIAAGARILVADHEETLEATGLTLGEIYHPTGYDACHLLAEHARVLPGVVAIETQSNADRGRRTIAVLPEHADRATALVDYWEGSLNLLELAFREQPAAIQLSTSR